MRMFSKTHPSFHKIIIQHSQGSEMDPIRIELTCITKTVMTLKPTMVSVPSRLRLVKYCFHNYDSFIECKAISAVL